MKHGMIYIIPKPKATVKAKIGIKLVVPVFIFCHALRAHQDASTSGNSGAVANRDTNGGSSGKSVKTNKRFVQRPRMSAIL